MTIAKKSVVWGLFAAGGTVAAFVFPVLIALFLLVAAGNVPEGLQYEKIHAFSASWLTSPEGRISRFWGEERQGSCQRRLPGCRYRHRTDGVLFVHNQLTQIRF
jgi:hypothetical protein